MSARTHIRALQPPDITDIINTECGVCVGVSFPNHRREPPEWASHFATDGNEPTEEEDRRCYHELAPPKQLYKCSVRGWRAADGVRATIALSVLHPGASSDWSSEGRGSII